MTRLKLPDPKESTNVWNRSIRRNIPEDLNVQHNTAIENLKRR